MIKNSQDKNRVGEKGSSFPPTSFSDLSHHCTRRSAYMSSVTTMQLAVQPKD